MAKQKRTLRIVEEAAAALSEHHPMTVRQVYYRLISRQVIENSRVSYQAVSNALVDARLEGIIPWEWIEDRLRMPRTVSMWGDLADFADTAISAYRRDVWPAQPGYVEFWLEKDALSGIFETVLRRYGVTLNVGRGYDGWSSIYNAAMRYREWPRVTVLYWGDFDPSGVQMEESLRMRLAQLGCKPEIVRCALTLSDVELYELPPCTTKKTDSRRAAFVAQYGDVSVELDALPPDVLEERIIHELASRMNITALGQVLEAEARDRRKLAALLTTAD